MNLQQLSLLVLLPGVAGFFVQTPQRPQLTPLSNKQRSSSILRKTEPLSLSKTHFYLDSLSTQPDVSFVEPSVQLERNEELDRVIPALERVFEASPAFEVPDHDDEVGRVVSLAMQPPKEKDEDLDRVFALERALEIRLAALAQQEKFMDERLAELGFDVAPEDDDQELEHEVASQYSSLSEDKSISKSHNSRISKDSSSNDIVDSSPFSSYGRKAFAKQEKFMEESLTDLQRELRRAAELEPRHQFEELQDQAPRTVPTTAAATTSSTGRGRNDGHSEVPRSSINGLNNFKSSITNSNGIDDSPESIIARSVSKIEEPSKNSFEYGPIYHKSSSSYSAPNTKTNVDTRTSFSVGASVPSSDSIYRPMIEEPSRSSRERSSSGVYQADNYKLSTTSKSIRNESPITSANSRSSERLPRSPSNGGSFGYLGANNNYKSAINDIPPTTTSTGFDTPTRSSSNGPGLFKNDHKSYSSSTVNSPSAGSATSVGTSNRKETETLGTTSRLFGPAVRENLSGSSTAATQGSISGLFGRKNTKSTTNKVFLETSSTSTLGLAPKSRGGLFAGWRRRFQSNKNTAITSSSTDVEELQKSKRLNFKSPRSIRDDKSHVSGITTNKKDHQATPTRTGNLVKSLWELHATRGVGSRKPATVQGGALLTWSFTNPNIELLHVLLKTDGRPMDASVELWQGPENAPQKMKVFVEDGAKSTFSTFIPTPHSPSTVAIRNTGLLEFPMQACVGRSSEQAACEVLEAAANAPNERIQGGGTVRTYPFGGEVGSVLVHIETDGRPLRAKIELLQGPNQNKQVLELYTEDGLDRPFIALIQTPGPSNVVRVTNVAPIEFPMTTTVAAYEEADEQSWENDGLVLGLNDRR